jgi:transcriptional regulator with XRE-family HTH domain
MVSDRQREEADAHREFWERLMTMLDDRGMTPADLADVIGTSRATISGWKIRGSWPSAWLLVRMADAIGCNVHWLLTGDDRANPPAASSNGGATLKVGESLVLRVTLERAL